MMYVLVTRWHGNAALVARLCGLQRRKTKECRGLQRRPRPPSRRYALSGMPEAATDFIQGIERETQLDAWCGRAEPFKDDPTIYNAMMAGREALVNGASKIKALTADQTRNEPQKHEAGGEVSAKTVAKLEETGMIRRRISKVVRAI